MEQATQPVPSSEPIVSAVAGESRGYPALPRLLPGARARLRRWRADLVVCVEAGVGSVVEVTAEVAGGAA